MLVELQKTKESCRTTNRTNTAPQRKPHDILRLYYFRENWIGDRHKALTLRMGGFLAFQRSSHHSCWDHYISQGISCLSIGGDCDFRETLVVNRNSCPSRMRQLQLPRNSCLSHSELWYFQRNSRPSIRGANSQQGPRWPKKVVSVFQKEYLAEHWL